MTITDNNLMITTAALITSGRQPRIDRMTHCGVRIFSENVPLLQSSLRTARDEKSDRNGKVSPDHAIDLPDFSIPAKAEQRLAPTRSEKRLLR
jgi:hypothetical protein